jgi:hypothetical protein
MISHTLKIADKIIEKPVYLGKLVKVVQELISINIHQKPDSNKNK